MAIQMPEPPYGKQWLDERGFVSRDWTTWIRQLFLRVGGTVAPSNLDLSDIPADHESRIDALEALASSQATSINALSQRIEATELEPVP